MNGTGFEGRGLWLLLVLILLLILLLQLDCRSGLDLLRLGCGRGRHGAGLASGPPSPGFASPSLVSFALLVERARFSDSRWSNELC